ncbi:acetyl-CoA carboxylase biotin carboxylase subunit [Temperatibacter marinus]|uniref:Acetyl-CoA carboxylase biotin carboxylase subunit n=1 Tax=Temperatibacter marinus TaxID=1456591 RepID=A0AA52H8W5_9PROT|nr:acetyl-CoA carboxylase biotin carboxylase subunit [Temperatibacter marinus]WND02541.1 acetyl-CoA carboxylase biotin carboxylase subunit [Temperatibacter marinus]
MIKRISKILIANRGEIACRVMQTSKEMGLSTVAVFSEADQDAMHVEMADEAVCIGPAAAAESYLVQQKIIEAARKTGAEAIHPGYGFLSENPDFAELCKANDIIFIGPSAESMNAMALKGTAKQLMIDAGVPVVPGYHGEAQDDETLYKAALDIGFPVLIKAVAGGGGKGMRAVESEKDLVEAIIAARSEGEKSFGNGKLLIEKLIQKPRHIELQVFGDCYGNAVHLMERDCSIQRRHQKVIEEAPAPGMTDNLRKEMGDAAVNAAKAVNYTGAGTVEFIVDVANGLEDAPFYFMEMNTRLQVEHPVTEMITGVDLVEWQIRVAQGEMLPMTQEAIVDGSYGHSIEVRLYAEDPANNFLPAIGTLEKFETVESDYARERVETGVRSGDEISIHYDPMIAKLVVLGDDRLQAIQSMQKLLKKTLLAGTRTNRDFLARLMHDENFIAANLDTGFLNGKTESLCDDPEPSAEDYAIAGLIHYALATNAPKENDPFAVLDGFRMNSKAQYTVLFKDASVLISEGETETTVTCLNKTYTAHRIDIGESEARLQLDGYQQEVKYSATDDAVMLAMPTYSHQLSLYKPDFETDAFTGGDGAVVSPMPGKILDIRSVAGDVVKAGDTILIMEAMKMEQSLTAPIDGIIENIYVNVQDQVPENTVLFDIQAQPEEE